MVPPAGRLPAHQTEVKAAARDQLYRSAAIRSRGSNRPGATPVALGEQKRVGVDGGRQRVLAQAGVACRGCRRARPARRGRRDRPAWPSSACASGPARPRGGRRTGRTDRSRRARCASASSGRRWWWRCGRARLARPWGRRGSLRPVPRRRPARHRGRTSRTSVTMRRRTTRLLICDSSVGTSAMRSATDKHSGVELGRGAETPGLPSEPVHYGASFTICGGAGCMDPSRIISAALCNLGTNAMPRSCRAFR